MMKQNLKDGLRAVVLASIAAFGAASLTTPTARAQEPAECRSTNPADIPAPSKPYFMLIADTSGSMNNCTNPATNDVWGDQSCPSTSPLNSCGLEPTRFNDAKCALRQTVQAFAGEVNFGLATFARKLSNCPAGACVDSCPAANAGNCPGTGIDSGEDYGCTLTAFTEPSGNTGCGNTPDCTNGNFQLFGDDWDNGGNIVVPLLQDPTWGPNPPASNVPDLLDWFDNDCGDNKELFANGYTPLEGSLRSVHMYLANGWAEWENGVTCDNSPYVAPPYTLTSPLDPANDRTCRSLNIILVTDGDESCGGSPSAAAAALYNTGVTIQGQQIPVRTFVIGLAGVSAATLEPIADSGDDGNASNNSTTALTASNETQLAQALATIIGGSVSPETCDNTDNNCNGCTDELYQVYCNRGRTPTPLATLQASGNDSMCCSFANATERVACLDAHAATISGGNPTGNRWLLPCWDPANTGTYGSDPTVRWLCTNPAEICDEADNNCELTFATADLATNISDENKTKCGSPAHCPLAETCNNEDDDCDGIIDNASGNGTPFSLPGCQQCIVSDEICDGCDNDNDGTADGFTQSCALAPTAECFGSRTCPAITVTPCTCDGGGNTFGACDVGRTVEPDDDTCDQFDDDCDGVRDEDALPTPCGNPAYYYGAGSRCQQGQQACNSLVCVGAIGPRTELCNGQDDNCDGFVDGTRPGGSLVSCNPLVADPCAGQGANSACAEDLVEGLGNYYCVIPTAGTGGACGTDNGQCSKGTIQCIGGALVCAGGVQPQPEDCNSIDDDCDSQTDEGTLADAPATPGCWNTPGSGCQHEEHSWDPPPGATCDGVGTLTAPCALGSLRCGAGVWSCVGPKGPSPETCDGLDNDCDGTPDDGNPGGGAACGTDVGDCTSGTLDCVSGALVCSGTGPFTEVCDGNDNDCDGIDDDTDPDVLGIDEVCGVDTGACQSGTTACVVDQLVCQGQITPQPEVCNGADDNCNGQVDEAPTDAPGNLGCWNFSTGADACSGGGITWDPPPGGTCTGLGGLTAPCSAGILVCTGASGWVCQGGTLPQPEACDNLDNDCDGTPDDNNPGGGGQCGANDAGECSYGTLQCVGGALSCQGEVVSTTEVCDGLDNDCDGLTDEGVTTGIGNPCGIATGACERGTTACVNGGIACVGGVLPVLETCNDVDDDCDGLIDESPSDAPVDPGCWDTPPADPSNPVCSFGGVDWDPPTAGATCTTPGTLSSPCTAGTLVCISGAWGCQGALPPSPESCDGADNNCDGTTDEGNPGGGANCSSAVGACTPGTLQCSGGNLVCSGGTSPTPERCNGADDDCDGFIDGTVPPSRTSCSSANGDADCVAQGVFSRCLEDQLSLGSFYCARPPAGFGGVCGTDVGACVRGVSACVAGASVCLGEVTPTPELCNGVDDDCDGVIDDTVTDAPANPGCWNVAPAGSPLCGFGSLVWDPPPGGTCTGLGTLTSPCSAGSIVCTGSSGWVCQGGRVPTVEVCDGIDNDCASGIDDGDPGGGGSCGNTDVGECALGTQHCVGGSVVCQGEIGPKPEVCDNLDNNCDGSTDNGITSGVGNPCGISTGACDRGVTACVAGTIQCTGGVNPIAEVCNAIDDDCDGLVDESPTDAPADPGCWDNPPANAGSPQCTFDTLAWDPPTAGATCTGTGTLPAPCTAGTIVCINGSWGCQGPLPPSPEVCDAVDNNCDGSTDEGNPGGGANCSSAVGACVPGTVQCSAGNLVCAGGTSPVAERCNDTDDDCDGFIDGTVPPSRVSCDPGNVDADCAGQGVFSRCLEDQLDLGSFYCARPPAGFGGVCGTDVGACVQGVSACVNGAAVCLGEVTPTPELCNGADDDCDGVIDDTPTDGPASPGCWNVAPAVPGSPQCSFGALGWDPPPGGACTGLGSLSSPCFTGTIVCNGLSGWVCQGGRVPAPEACDAVDNDCNAAVDDGDPGGGGSCGTTDVGECAFGTEHCVGGQIRCQGEVVAKAELCDGLDNDCDAQTDENAPGAGKDCGLSTGACQRGLTECVGGTLLCVGGTLPAPEQCDGVDNDCNGLVDDGALSDAPASRSCWNNAGTTCSHEEATWDPPAGAGCQALGTLQLPCSLGVLLCNGVSGWTCAGGTLPGAEVCDGIDNNCDGTPDDGNPGGGAQCGSDVGACELGVEACVSGTIQCTGDTGPAAEVCDGVDNDCDGNTDDGITLGEPCAMQYDALAYPGARAPGVGICRAGVTDCDPAGSGAFICIQGQAPEPEVCDGLDNDCDGAIDELGPAPDGISGTADPADPSRRIGDACGTDVGACVLGQYACVGGQFACQGGRTAQREVCDCVDNDCDGEVDEVAGASEPALCPGSSVCASVGGECQCADTCRRGEFPCGTGTQCERDATLSGTTDTVDVCWSAACPGGCESRTVTRQDGTTECGPAGTRDGEGNAVPLCECKGGDGCHGPCFRVSCDTDLQCVATAGQFQGTCRPQDDCRFFGCDVGQACSGGTCVASSCTVDTCAADEVCKPNSTFDDFRCVGSCIDVDCAAGEACREGACEATGCGVDCATGEVCVGGGAGDAGAACVGSPCPAPLCADGSYCEPTTGACIENPCAGVVCPVGGVCAAGECVREAAGPPDAGAGGSGGGSNVGGTTGGGGTPPFGGGAVGGNDGTGRGGTSGRGGGGGSGEPGYDEGDDVFGLATGGGGCRCDVAATGSGSRGWLFALLALGLVGARRASHRNGGAR